MDILCSENVKLKLHYWTWHRLCVTSNFCSFNYFGQCSWVGKALGRWSKGRWFITLCTSLIFLLFQQSSLVGTRLYIWRPNIRLTQGWWITQSILVWDKILVDFTLPFTTNEIISISTSQTFGSWAVIFHLRRPKSFLFLSSYDTHRLTPRMNVLFWGPGDFQVIYSNRDTSWDAWNRHKEVIWSIRGSYSAKWSLPLSNV